MRPIVIEQAPEMAPRNADFIRIRAPKRVPQIFPASVCATVPAPQTANTTRASLNPVRGLTELSSVIRGPGRGRDALFRPYPRGNEGD